MKLENNLARTDYYVREFDINEYPFPLLFSEEHTQITIGDLHANPIKLIHFLLLHGVIEFDEKAYKKFIDAYNLYGEIPNKESLETIISLIKTIELKNKNYLIRIMGDELADRGNNDYFVLKLLEHLIDKGARITNIYSNHAAAFMYGYESLDRNHTYRNNTIAPECSTSLTGLEHALAQGFIEQSEINQIIEQVYKPIVKLIDYSLSKDGTKITIYSHAPIGIETVKALAEKFKRKFDDKSPLSLAATIEQINNEFHSYLMANKISSLCSANEAETAARLAYSLDLDSTNPIAVTIWNRNYQRLNRPWFKNKYSITFVHGHDMSEMSLENCINLDNNFGKLPLADDIDVHKDYATDDFNLLQYKIHEKARATLLPLLNNLDKNIAQQKSTNNILTANALGTIATMIRNEYKTYLICPNENTYETFKIHTVQIIDENIKYLHNKNAVAKKLLANIGLAVLGLGVCYFAAVCVNKAMTGNFLFFSDKTTELLKQISTSTRDVKVIPDADLLYSLEAT